MSESKLPLIAHLLRRAGFGASRDELEAYAAKGYDATLEELLHPEHAPPALQGEDLIRRYHGLQPVVGLVSGGLGIYESQALGHPVDVGIHGEGGHLEGLRHHHTRRLVPHARQGFQLLQTSRYVASKLRYHKLRERADVFRFRRRQPTRFDSRLDLSDGQTRHLCWRVGEGEEECGVGPAPHPR